MKYKMHVKEIDNHTDYPINVLMGLTGLGEETIQHLIDDGKISSVQKDGESLINGKEFLNWSTSVNHTIDVQKTHYTKMKVDE